MKAGGIFLSLLFLTEVSFARSVVTESADKEVLQGDLLGHSPVPSGAPFELAFVPSRHPTQIIVKYKDSVPMCVHCLITRRAEFHDKHDLYLFDLVKQQKSLLLNNGDLSSFEPTNPRNSYGFADVSGNRMVWQDTRLGRSDVYLTEF